MTNEKITIMVIEDEKILLDTIVKKTTLSNITPLPFMSAEDAIEYLRTMHSIPDGVWLDYHLQGMNGMDFLKVLKDNPKWKDIPVVIVSNSANSSTVKNVLELGAEKYILKAEFRLEDIITEIKEIINAKKQ